MTKARALGSLFGLTLLLILPALSQGAILYVNNADPTCQGQSPCFSTIQSAVNAAQAGDTIRIQVGTYLENVIIDGKNNFAGAAESDRIVIEADPLSPPGSVLLTAQREAPCSSFGFRIKLSKFITVRGLAIGSFGGEGISLFGGASQNQAIHIERNRIFGSKCSSGIIIDSGNPATLIVNNLKGLCISFP